MTINFWLVLFLMYMVYSSAYSMTTAPKHIKPTLVVFLGLLWGVMYGAGILTDLW